MLFIPSFIQHHKQRCPFSLPFFVHHTSHLFFLRAQMIINHLLSCFVSLPASWDLMGKLYKYLVSEYFTPYSSTGSVISSNYTVIYLFWYNMSQFRLPVLQTIVSVSADNVRCRSSVWRISSHQGPFVHIASICAAVLSRFMSIFSGVYEVSQGPDQNTLRYP